MKSKPIVFASLAAFLLCPTTHYATGQLSTELQEKGSEHVHVKGANAFEHSKIRQRQLSSQLRWEKRLEATQRRREVRPYVSSHHPTRYRQFSSQPRPKRD